MEVYGYVRSLRGRIVWDPLAPATREVIKMFPVHCAWCGKVIGECVVEHSDGICKRCAAKALAEAETCREAEQREQAEVTV